MVVGDTKGNTSPWESLIAGGTAGGIEAAMTYPFEFAKTRVQLRYDPKTDGPQNPFKIIARVVRNEGLGSLYTGCTTLIAGTIVKDGLRFLTFDAVRSAFKDPETGKLTVGRSLLAGMAAGVVASIGAVTPSERIKTALIDDARSTKRFQGPIHCIKTLVAENGPAALYRGFWGTTLKQGSTTAVRLGTYDMIKTVEAGRGIEPGAVVTFANGSVVGATTVLTTQPFDTVKTRAQSARGEGLVEATTGIYKDYGVRGFWKGSTMRLGRNVFSGAILFSAYEQVARLVHPMFEAAGVTPTPSS